LSSFVIYEHIIDHDVKKEQLYRSSKCHKRGRGRGRGWERVAMMEWRISNSSGNVRAMRTLMQPSSFEMAWVH